MPRNPDRTVGTAAYRAAQRRRAYLKETGRPCMLEPEERMKVVAHVKGLHANGMTCRQIADAAGHSSSDTVAHMVFDKRPPETTRIRRTTANALMAVELEGHRGWGARRDPTIPRRMLQALHAEGFSIPFLAGLLDRPSAALYEFEHGNRGGHYMRYAWGEAIVELYVKLAGTDPADYGMSQQSITAAKSWAQKYRYAPSFCWDEDTIIDPDAIPEWTGACGSLTGYNIHKREDILMCFACASVAAAKKEYKIFDRHAFRDARLRAGLSVNALARESGVDSGSVSGWEKGRCQPSLVYLNKVLPFLNATESDFYEEDPT